LACRPIPSLSHMFFLISDGLLWEVGLLPCLFPGPAAGHDLLAVLCGDFVAVRCN
jgi:hypothetical protein